MKLIIFIAVILVLLFFFIRFLEYKSLYYPFRSIQATPEEIDLDYEDVILTTKDGVQLNGWFIPSDTPRATILFSHGNGGNIGHRLEKLKMLNDLSLNVLIYDYRGYGRSKGKPSEGGLYLDAEAAYEYLVSEKKIRSDRIIAYGESLGGAVAVDLAVRHNSGAVIIEEGFTSVKDMAKKIFPFIPSFIYKSSYNSLEKIKSVKVPKLIFHSADDEIVPFEQGQRLFDNASEPKKFVQLQGGHNDAFLVSRDIFISEINELVSNYKSANSE